MPPIRWTSEQSRCFWEARSTRVIGRIPDLHSKVRNMERARADHDSRRQQKRDKFVKRYTHRQDNTASNVLKTTESENVQFWCTQQSWSYCESCGALQPQKLIQSYHRRNPVVSKTLSVCATQRYPVPSYRNIPRVLQRLTPQGVLSLRPIDVHCGYVRRQYGYRQRTSPFTVTWSALSVLEKIHNIPDVRRRQRVMAAYTFLIDNQESSYRDFVCLRERVTRNPYDFKIYSHPQFRRIECALWPNLYIKTAWCKSALDGSASL